MSPPVASSLANRLLVALPALHDPNFARSVTLLCQHDGDGAMGVVVNRISEYTLGEVFRQMGIASDDEALQARAVLAGGPVHPERGFVIHDGDGEWDSSLEIGDGLRLTTSRDVLEAIARGEGPAQATVALGCAGWGGGAAGGAVSHPGRGGRGGRFDDARQALCGCGFWRLSVDPGAGCGHAVAPAADDP